MLPVKMMLITVIQLTAVAVEEQIMWKLLPHLRRKKRTARRVDPIDVDEPTNADAVVKVDDYVFKGKLIAKGSSDVNGDTDALKCSRSRSLQSSGDIEVVT